MVITLSNRVAAVMLLLTGPAAAATLRPFTTLAAPVVRLSDLFSDAGSEANRVLGPAPAPGTRISVEARQLAAIAREYGVAWRPATGFEQAVLVRPGEKLGEAPVLAALRTALTGFGTAPGSGVVLQGFAAPTLPVGAVPQIAVEQLSYDAGPGTFQGMLAIGAPGVAAIVVPVTGRCVRRAILPVAVHRLEPGTALGPGDLIEREVALTGARDAVVRDAALAIGHGVRRPVAAGKPVPLDDLVSLPTIGRGERVEMEIAAPGLQVTATGVSLGDAGVGEVVDVLNPASHAVVQATVLGPGRVAVAEGSVPLHQGASHPGIRR